VNVFVTGQNLFVITKFTGFDPEVNTDKNIDGVPSLGIEYTPYPTARTFTLGFNFSL
jgi:TonB-dependent starch-binding outer membrane protein SusC